MFNRKKIKSNLTKKDREALARLLGVKKEYGFIIFTSKYRPMLTSLTKIHNNYAYETDVYLLLGDLKDGIKKCKNKYGKEIYDTKASNIRYVPALMIDIDSHRFGLREDDAKEIVKTLIYRLKEYYTVDLVPDEISYTGRGIQLFYNVNEYDISKRRIVNLAKDLRDLIIGEIKIIIDEMNHYFKDLGIRIELEIDRSTSVRRQLFRCPGFINTKSGYEAHFLYVHHRPKRIVMGEFIKELKEDLGIKPTGRKYVKFKKNRKYHNIRELHNKRERDTLAYLYRHGKGVRHKCYTNLITIKLNRGDSKEEIVKSLSEIDSILEDSYYRNDKEIEKEVDYISRYWGNKSNGIIKISNENMIEYLGISEEELQNEQWETFRRAERGSVNRVDVEGIYELYKGKVSVTEIARREKCSRTTVYKYIKIYEILNKENKLNLLSAVRMQKDALTMVLKNIFNNSNIPDIENLNRQKMNTNVKKEIKKDILLE